MIKRVSERITMVNQLKGEQCNSNIVDRLFAWGYAQDNCYRYSDWAKQYRSFRKTAIRKYGLQVDCNVFLQPSGSEVK